VVPGTAMLQEKISTDAAAYAVMLLKRSAQGPTLVELSTKLEKCGIR
jgi:hypothetical protein